MLKQIFEGIRMVFGFLFLSSIFVGYFVNMYNEIRYERIIDVTTIMLPTLLIGVWCYVKVEAFIKGKLKRQD